LISVIGTRQSARTDEELVDRARVGDLDAFETLVGRHYGVVRRVAERIVGASHADDVAQDAFLRAFHRLGQFRRESTFRSWLLRIAHNAALTVLERERSRQGDDREQGLELETHSTAVRTPVDQLEVDERRDRLAGKLRLLSPAHRTVLVLRDLEGLSYEEIAVATDTPLGSVKGRLHRARRELIDLLRANTYDWDLPPA
jgi:RNA polymerase sigma-70 factor (ECF subfamily)